MGASSDAWLAAPRPKPCAPVFLDLLEDAASGPVGPTLPVFDGRYQLLEREATAGPLQRWLAHQLGPGGLKTLVRIKHLPPGAPEREVWQAALLDEARALSAVDHPNVVRLIQVLDDDTGLSLVREHIDGVALSQVLSICQGAGAGLRMDLAAYLASEILWVVDAVHAATDAVGRSLGLVHRGVHPSQVQITRRGHVKLDGFDLVRMNSGRRVATQPGLVKGFAAYLPPECIAGEVATPAADVYAVGVMLFELLTGEACFDGETASQILWKVVREGPALHRLERHRVPPELRQIVRRATEASPQDRFGSAAEMARQLDAYGELIRRHGRPWQVAGLFESQGLYPRSPAERFSESETAVLSRQMPAAQASARVSSGFAEAELTEVSPQQASPSTIRALHVVDPVFEPVVLDDADVMLVEDD